MNRLKFILYLLSGAILLLLITGLVLFLSLASDIPRLPDDLRLLASSPTTEIYARNGDLLSTSGGREYVSLDRIAPSFRDAILAVEDKRFWKHRGIDRISTFRALIHNVIRFGDAPGGSTISQQLAKNLFFSFERSWKRKLLEAMAAMAIEDRFSKEEILEAYCNLIPFGQYSYGIERASLTYFGKHASDLQPHESALLAGLPNSPSRLNPFYHLDRARVRQKVILRRMAHLGMIPVNAADSLTDIPIELTGMSRRSGKGSFAVDHALELARRTAGSDVVNYGGVRIITSIDPRLQKIAERELAAGLDALEKRLKDQEDEYRSRLEGALIAIDVGSGQILALVGGRDYTVSPYNRAVKSLRQPGSSFKPIIYLAALAERDINPATLVNDTLTELRIDKRRTWKVNNFDHRYMGWMILKQALMESRNVIAAQLIERITPERAIRTAKALGITTELKPHLSLALGSQGVTVLEMADVYATLARGGVALEPHLVSRVEGRGGKILMEHMAAGESRFSPEDVYQLLDMMTGVIDGGTGSIVRRRGFKGIAAGKTGTSSDFRDSWFVGATPYLAVAVWVGYDDNREMRLGGGPGVTGASGAAPIWADFMISATGHEPVREFRRPPSIGRYYVDPLEGTIDDEPREGFIPVALRSAEAAKLAPYVEAEIDTTSPPTLVEPAPAKAGGGDSGGVSNFPSPPTE